MKNTLVLLALLFPVVSIAQFAPPPLTSGMQQQQMTRGEESTQSNATSASDSSSISCDSECKEKLEQKEKKCKSEGYDQLQCAYSST